MRTKLLFPIFLTVFFLSGCASQPAVRAVFYPRAVRIDSASYIPLEDFCRGNQISYSIDKISSIAELNVNGKIVKIMPDSNISLIDGSAKKFSPKTKIEKNEIYLPLSLIKYLEKDLLKKKMKRFAVRKIVIDPGHGGTKDLGAVGRSYKTQEKTIVLDIAENLKNELLAMGDFEIIMTRETDKAISLSERSDIANNSNADLFVSVHANASTSRKPKGFEVYYFPYKTKAKKIAEEICENAKKNGLYVRKKPIKQARFYVLRNTNMPAVLIEIGFLSNRGDEERIRNAWYRKKLAKVIKEGLISWIKGQ